MNNATDEKLCNRCNEIKPLDAFYSYEKFKSNGDKYIYYRPDCIECCKSMAVKYDKENPEKRKEIQRKANKKKKDLITELNKRNRENGTYRNWLRSNKDKVKNYTLYRSMHKTHTFSKEVWVLCKEYFNYECAYCGISESDAKLKYNNYLHKEHVKHNGSNDIDNCVPSCKSCNGSKHIYELDEWYNENNYRFTHERLKKIERWLNEDVYNIEQH